MWFTFPVKSACSPPDVGEGGGVAVVAGFEFVVSWPAFSCGSVDGFASEITSLILASLSFDNSTVSTYMSIRVCSPICSI